MTSAPLDTCVVATPLGAIRLLASRDALVRADFVDDAPAERPEGVILARAARELGEYFEGSRTAFTVPLAPEGTAFQRAVWSALLAIPHGQTRSYLDVARAIGNPAAVRAVGAANGRNPITVIVPCHRVIGARGDLVGYAFGVERKRWLLAHEASNQNSAVRGARGYGIASRMFPSPVT